jgi:alkylhydroperoxidase/carboxymuconolactone decarboxylase family protein YurZ
MAEAEAWVAIAPRRTVPRGQGRGYDLGFIPAMGRLIAAHPGIAPEFGALFQKVMFGPGELARAEREMVAAVAAAAQDCHY